MGCLASEMESAAIFVVSGYLKSPCRCLFSGNGKSGKRETGTGKSGGT